ncbi:hypothetical protein H6768_04460 [Candidatus Peribacteria bacterium]|nr:hypothetical protein [Candidatus Peribacteria bacterium]
MVDWTFFSQKVYLELSEIVDQMVAAGVAEDLVDEVRGVDGVVFEEVDLAEGVQVASGKIEREKVNTLPSINSVAEL